MHDEQQLEQEQDRDFEVIMASRVSRVPWGETEIIVRVLEPTTNTATTAMAVAPTKASVGCSNR